MAEIQHQVECVDVGDSADKIGKLPDEILGKILSYVPTKQAVATCILSKRWEHIWTLTSQIDFDDSFLFGCEKKNKKDCRVKCRFFKEYVDRVLFFHGGSTVRKCKISFLSNCVGSRIYSWICALITCNLQELVLEYMSFHKAYQLPWMLFSFNTLVFLKINRTFVLDLPKYVYFPCLKLLHIDRAIFLDDASSKRLFSGCPVLEELSIHIRSDFLQILDISVPSLKSLCLRVSSEIDYFQITINTPLLEYLQLYDREHAPSQYSVNFTSSLVCAQLKGFDISLLNGVSQVESLVLTGDDMSLHKMIRYSALPTFKNLKTLKLCVGWPSVVDWRFLPILLECTPNPQVLIFPEGLVSLAMYKDQFNNFSWQWAESVPECLSLHLKTVEIFNFLGFPVELHLVEYLLEYAKVLEKMIIHWFEFNIDLRMEDEVDEEDDKVMFDLLRSRKSSETYEVMNFERSSSTCDIIFTD